MTVIDPLSSSRLISPALLAGPPVDRGRRLFKIARFCAVGPKLADRILIAVLLVLLVSSHPAGATPPENAPGSTPQNPGVATPTRSGVADGNAAGGGIPRLMTPGEVTSGSLLLEAAASGKFVEAPRIATDVAITISGPLARTRVTQRFENPTDGWVEGVYVFPLPDMSAVDTLRLQIGDRLIEGAIEEKQKAKAIYTAAKAAGKKASLMAQERANVFTNAVANIGPYETVVVQIEYQEMVQIDGDGFSLRVPMVVAPRYHPAPFVQNVNFSHDGDGWGGVAYEAPRPVGSALNDVAPAGAGAPTDNGPINPITLSVDLDAGFPLGPVKSAYHSIVVDRTSENKARLRLVEEAVPANRDFELRWRAQSGAAPGAALFVETINGEDFYIAMVTPPVFNNTDNTDNTDDGANDGDTENRRSTVAKREAIFVIDTSGSMAGESIRQAKASLQLALQRLKPTDSFNVVQFNSTMDVLFPEARQAHPHTVATALNYVERLDAGGGTEMLPALNAALSMTGLNDDRIRQVMFLTDGAISNEEQLFKAISDNLGGARVFTVGIGSAPNSFFMSRAAEIGRGSFTHIGDLNEVTARMSALFEKLETPIVTGLSIDWSGNKKGVGPANAQDRATMAASQNDPEIWPHQPPDVYRGEVVSIAAKLKSPLRGLKSDDDPGANAAMSGVATITGMVGDQPWQANLRLDQASRRPGVSKLWARRKIASLELARVRARHGRGDHRTGALPDYDAQILQTALDHHLISRLTSLVAVDRAPSRPVDAHLRRADVPLALPAGWDFGAVFGAERNTITPSVDRETRLRQNQEFAQYISVRSNNPTDPTAPPDVVGAKDMKSSVHLPQGGLLSDAKIYLGLLLSAMGALLFLIAFGPFGQATRTRPAFFPAGRQQ